MLSFENDYSEGAHEKILARLAETNRIQATGYGKDEFCESARRKIREACAAPEASVWFISGGTQANAIVIASMLNKTQGVLAAETGHINGHEAGAIEFTGHKVLPLPQHEGKMKAEELKKWLAGFFADLNHESMIAPGMVYLSHPTEYGTLYSKAELTAISAVCREYDLPLFMDGARLGYALACPASDLTLPDIASLCDVFYIGGTKVGALCGEAVVFPKGNAPAHFYTHIKQQGALLAKGRLMGVQFDTLFEDGLYYELGRNGIEKAEKLRRALKGKGYRFFLETPANQIFVILENEQMKALGEKVRFGFWERTDDAHTVVRFATSWATTDEMIDQLIALL